MTFYDLRSTGITWEVLAGTERSSSSSAGHLQFSTTEGYIRAAEELGKSIEEPFPALPANLLAVAQDHTSGSHQSPELTIRQVFS
jgi:hypothetical protein